MSVPSTATTSTSYALTMYMSPEQIVRNAVAAEARRGAFNINNFMIADRFPRSHTADHRTSNTMLHMGTKYMGQMMTISSQGAKIADLFEVHMHNITLCRRCAVFIENSCMKAIVARVRNIRFSSTAMALVPNPVSSRNNNNNLTQK